MKKPIKNRRRAAGPQVWAGLENAPKVLTPKVKQKNCHHCGGLINHGNEPFPSCFACGRREGHTCEGCTGVL